MKCSLCCSHASRLESLVFLWLRRVCGASCKTSPFRRSPTVKIGGSLPRNAPRVSSRVSGFPVASPCLYGGSCKTSPFWRVSSRLSYRFCVASVAFCDIPIIPPTCFIPCRKCQNWRKSRMKCSLCCSHVSRLESLVFLWPRRVYKGRCKTSPFRRFSIRLSYRFAWQAWHLVTFQHVLYRVESVKIGGILA